MKGKIFQAVGAPMGSSEAEESLVSSKNWKGWSGCSRWRKREYGERCGKYRPHHTELGRRR